MTEIICSLEGVKWCIIGDKVFVDPRYLREYKSTVRRRLPCISRAIAIHLVAYAAVFIGAVVYSIYLVHL